MNFSNFRVRMIVTEVAVYGLAIVMNNHQKTFLKKTKQNRLFLFVCFINAKEKGRRKK